MSFCNSLQKFYCMIFVCFLKFYKIKNKKLCIFYKNVLQRCDNCDKIKKYERQADEMTKRMNGYYLTNGKYAKKSKVVLSVEL